MANINDIAKLAGVSIATVSRALTKPGVVRAETFKKIEAAIAELQYHPNMLASGLRRKRSDNIIVAIPSIFNPFTSAFVQGIENVARAAGYRLLLGITESDPVLLSGFVNMIAGKQADGMIVLDRLLPTTIFTGLTIPIVAACEYPPDIAMPRVRFDNVEATVTMVSHLASLGHKHIASITGPLDQYMARDRLAGFRLGLKRAGLTLDDTLVVQGDFSLESGYRAMVDLLAVSAPMTGVCCANDEMALGALAALREAGLDVPGQISVAGFDNLRFAEYASPPLTTIAVPTMETGETAMRLMLDLLRDPVDAVREVVLPHRLIVRQSTGVVPR